MKEWIIIFIFILLLGSYAIGFYLGFKNTSDRSEGRFARVSNIHAGLMGLLGVMLAFSFSLSSQRFEQRRQLIIQESMKIGTAYFRAGLLPDSFKIEIRKLIRQYIDERITYYKSGNTLEDLDVMQTRAENIQIKIWFKTAVLGKEHPTLNTNLNILSLNEMIDVSGNISSSFQSRVPIFIHLLLTFITFCTVLTIGYSDGLSNDRNIVFMIILSMILCAILLLIIDLDTPFSGFLKSDIFSLKELKREILRYYK